MPEIHKGRIAGFLNALPLFADLPPPDMDAFLKSTSQRTYKKQQSVFLQGDKADRLFIVMEGWVKLFSETVEGDESVMALYTRGDIFGEAAVFSDTGYPLGAEAAEETTLLEIPASVLKERAKLNNDIMMRMMQVIAREMRGLQIENEHLALMSAPQRVGCLLLQLSGGMKGKGGTFTFPYDKALAARRLGMKPETFSRALAQLQPVGVTVNGGEVTVNSFSDLAGYTCVHCVAMPGECRKCEHGACEECPGRKISGGAKTR